jgi:hypothetical protein
MNICKKNLASSVMEGIRLLNLHLFFNLKHVLSAIKSRLALHDRTMRSYNATLRNLSNGCFILRNL